MKRILSVILVLSIMFLMGFNTLAYDDSYDAIYIYSEEIPSSVEAFALNTANSFSTELYKALDIDDKDICDLKLMQGFIPYEYDACERQVYYFPLQGNGKIIAMLKVVETGYNEYSAQVERGDIESFLNDIVQFAVAGGH